MPWAEAAMVGAEELELETGLRLGGACGKNSIWCVISASEAIFSQQRRVAEMQFRLLQMSEVGPFKLTSACSAYWPGQSNVV